MEGVHFDAPGLPREFIAMGYVLEIDCLRGKEVFVYVLPSWLADDDVM